ncbi:hypothetical protein [Corallibacter sp.]|uniref:hypothetical protein n=1 Tax=Corallibacter sp. TaxID=2038084 RepID=UPI003AB758F8
MILINTVSENYFTLNGTQYAKIFHPFKQGVNAIGIYNVNDTKQQLINSTHYSQFSINSTTYASQDDVISALLPVIYKPYNDGDDDTFSTWGEINGNIQSQADLIALLNTKADLNDISVVGFSNNYNDLDNLPSFSAYTTFDNTGVQLSANHSGQTISLLNDNGDVLDILDVGFLNNEGTTLEYSASTESIIIKNDEGEILSSIPVSSFLTGVGDNLFLAGYNLQLRDSSNSILSSVPLNINNINGLSSALTTLQSNIDIHEADNDNPHQVSFNQLTSTGHTHSMSDINGLSANISTMYTLIDGKVEEADFNSHTGNTSNPHNTSFNNLSSTAHTHTVNDISNFPSSLPTSSTLQDVINNGNTTTNDIRFNDGVRTYYGTNDDTEIFYNNSSGQLRFKINNPSAASFVFRNSDDNIIASIIESNGFLTTTNRLTLQPRVDIEDTNTTYISNMLAGSGAQGNYSSRFLTSYSSTEWFRIQRDKDNDNSFSETLLTLSNTGDLKANSFIKTNGTSTQFLKADGSVDDNTYVEEDISEWQTFVVVGGISSANSIKYKLINGRLIFIGSLTSTTNGRTKIGTLASGYRPDTKRRSYTSFYGILEFETNGDVYAELINATSIDLDAEITLDIDY